MTEHALDQLEVQPSNLLAERAAYVEAVIRHRCGDVITDADLARPASEVKPEVVMIPSPMAERLSEVLELMCDRLDKIEGWIGTKGTA
jgi:hypothetical protein